MMMISGKTLPKYPANGEYIREFVEPYNSKVGWKVTQTFEAALLRKKQLAEQETKKKDQVMMKNAQ